MCTDQGGARRSEGTERINYHGRLGAWFRAAKFQESAAADSSRPLDAQSADAGVESRRIDAEHAGGAVPAGYTPAR
jgi:hypothetical protein